MEKIMIYGMGYEAQKLIKNMANSSQWQIAAVTDSTINTGGGYVKSQVFPYQSLCRKISAKQYVITSL